MEAVLLKTVKIQNPKHPSTFKALIFDLDGTLVDSEPIYKKANKVFLAKHSIEVPEERWNSFVGIGARAFINIIKNDYGLKGETEDLMKEMDEHFADLAKAGLKSFPGSAKLAHYAKAQGIKQAIASGSTPDAIRRSLEWSGLASYFSRQISANQVPRGKPFPDVFLEAAKQLTVEPADCLVLEDSISGIQAGLAAGMNVLAFAPENTKDLQEYTGDEVYHSAHFLVEAGASSFEAEEFIQYFFGS